MKEADYSKIAPKYDQTKFRLEIPPDKDLVEYINQQDNNRSTILDLACGTGNYLSRQVRLNDTKPVVWHGLDASEDMLTIAHNKTKQVHLVQARAEKVPYRSLSIDFVVDNFAFHHFADKGLVLDEISRILKPGGFYKMHNIDLFSMSSWWVYHFFPTAYSEDLNRFWPRDLIVEELITRDFRVSCRKKNQIEKLKVMDVLSWAENKDISTLTLIDNDCYLEGLARIRKEIQKDPQATITNEFTELFYLAQKI